MSAAETSTSPATHPRFALAHLLGFLISLAAFGAFVIPAAPLFIKLLLPFPVVDDATHWSGRVELEATRHQLTPRFYILTTTGRYEFKCGYFGDRTACSNYQVFHGATGEVWYHPIFGALQWRLVIGPGRFAGDVEEHPIAALKQYHQEQFPYSKYISKLLIALSALVCAAWQLKRFKHHRAAATSTTQQLG